MRTTTEIEQLSRDVLKLNRPDETTPPETGTYHLFEHMSRDHGLTLIESELQEIRIAAGCDRLERERNEARNQLSTETEAKLRALTCAADYLEELRESRKLCAQMSQEREHNGCQALMWRAVADGLAKTMRSICKLPTLEAQRELQEAMRRFEEVTKA